MATKILVVTHKKYQMPKGDIYVPILAGSSFHDEDYGYQRDDTGDNISIKNKEYCELTALYWAYKNIKAEYIGLFHYRRYLDLKEISIEDCEIIVPKKRHYFIVSIYKHFSISHKKDALDITRDVIKDKYPDYLPYFDQCMSARSLHICNMFIMKYAYFVEYCDFMFDVLFSVEGKVGKEDRLYGFIGERLLDVYLNYKKVAYVERKLINLEKINWPKKIIVFTERILKYKS